MLFEISYTWTQFLLSPMVTAISPYPHVIASGVNTLDEARYFAAMGADWIGFHLENHTPQYLRTISDWISGPKRFVEMKALDPESLFELVSKLDPDGICIPAEVEVPDWFKGTVIRKTRRASNPSEVLYREFLPTESTSDIASFTEKSPVWISVSGNDLLTLSQILGMPVAGIVLLPQTDSEGFPDFEAYDAIFQLINESR